LAKGFRGRAKNCKSIAIRAVHHALQKSYKSRRLHKREIRKTWIAQINAGVRQYGLNYGTFIYRTNIHNIKINRKILAELAVYEPYSFRAVTKEIVTPVEEEEGYNDKILEPIETKESS